LVTFPINKVLHCFYYLLLYAVYTVTDTELSSLITAPFINDGPKYTFCLAKIDLANH